MKTNKHGFARVVPHRNCKTKTYSGITEDKMQKIRVYHYGKIINSQINTARSKERDKGTIKQLEKNTMPLVSPYPSIITLKANGLNSSITIKWWMGAKARTNIMLPRRYPIGERVVSYKWSRENWITIDRGMKLDSCPTTHKS